MATLMVAIDDSRCIEGAPTCRNPRSASGRVAVGPATARPYSVAIFRHVWTTAALVVLAEPRPGGRLRAIAPQHERIVLTLGLAAPDVTIPVKVSTDRGRLLSRLPTAPS